MKVTIGPYPKGDKERKVKIVIDKFDSWNAEHTLALIAAPLLKQLKETKHGAPFVDDEDVPEHLRSTACPPKENEWDVDENHFKRFDYVLDEVIFAMEEIANWNENEPEIFKHVGDMEWSEADPATGLHRMISSGCVEIPEMVEPNRLYHERIKKGCLLLGKYWLGMWD